MRRQDGKGLEINFGIFAGAWNPGQTNGVRFEVRGLVYGEWKTLASRELRPVARTTASDALWAGVPVLTYAGRGFAWRVAGSLLTTIGLGDLATCSLEDYEALASELPTNRERLTGYRRTSAESRAVSPLFDGARFARDLEAAFAAMVTAWRDGRSVVLPPCPASQRSD